VPIFILQCKKCNYETEILLHTERAIVSFKCSECGAKGLWEKCVTAPALKRDGTYSYLENLKK